MTKFFYIAWLLMLLMIVAALAGCQSAGGQSPWQQEPAPPSYTFFADRSLTFASPELRRRAGEQAESADGGLAWYSVRNDARLGTTAGIESPTYESIVTYAIDRQYHAGDRVFDTYLNRTYRVRSTESVR